MEKPDPSPLPTPESSERDYLTNPLQPKLEEGEDPSTYTRCITFLSQNNIPFRTYSHKAVKTSKEAAEERGVPLDSGAKALLVKYATKETALKFALLVMSAGRKVNWKDVKNLLGSKNVVFATLDEVKSVAGCIPGAVPPFGSVFGVPTLLDPSLQAQGDTINFNCGLRSHTVTMKTQDYVEAEKPKISPFTTE